MAVNPRGARARGLTVKRAHLAMLVYSFLISTSFPVGKMVAVAVDPVVVTFLRFALAATVFAGILTVSSGWRTPRPSDLVRYGVIALPLVVFFVAMFEALRWTDALSAGAIFTLLPLFSAGYAFLLLRERLSAPLALVLVTGGIGALWVLSQGSVDRILALEFGRGEAIFAFGCLAFAAHSPLIKKLHGGEPIHHLTFWSLALGTIMLSLLGAPRIWNTDWAGIPFQVYLGVIYLAVSNTAFTFYLVKSASVVLTPAKVIAYTYLIPGFVVLLAATTGQGWPPGLVFIGIGITTAAMVAMQRID